MGQTMWQIDVQSSKHSAALVRGASAASAAAARPSPFLRRWPELLASFRLPAPDSSIFRRSFRPSLRMLATTFAGYGVRTDLSIGTSETASPMQIQQQTTVDGELGRSVPKGNGAIDHFQEPLPITCFKSPNEKSKSVRKTPKADDLFRLSHHAIEAFTVQCSGCMKWRWIPSKENYEEIRQSILEKPFFCNHVAAWRPKISCDDPSDVSPEDDSFLWAIDKPNIPRPPNGWERLVVKRAAGASKFADVYYVAPSGKKVRSMPEVVRILSEHPEYVKAGVNTSQFSFMIPKPLEKAKIVDLRSQKKERCKGEESQSRMKLPVWKKASAEQNSHGLSGNKIGKRRRRRRKNIASLIKMSFRTLSGPGMPSGLEEQAYSNQDAARR